MKKTLTVLTLALIALSANAQVDTRNHPVPPQAPVAAPVDQPAPAPKPQKVHATVYGFVRNYLTFDSRGMYTVCGSDYNNMPFDESWNLAVSKRDQFDEADVNDIPTMQFHALSTRFGLRLDGPNVLGAKSTGRIEADFAGFSTTNTVLRLRLAYVDLNWGGRHALRVGQDWHPLSGEIMPDALGFAAGAPFRPHSRTPQFRYMFSTASGLGAQAHLLYQYQFQSPGPDGASEKYANNALIPEFFVGLNYRQGPIYAQIGADVLTIRPRSLATETATEYVYNGSDNVLTTIGDYKTKVDDRLTSVSPTVYFQYVEGLFSVKLRSTYAQNTAHVNQISGYGISAFNPDGSQDYTPLRSSISYINFAYGKKFKGNLFFGFMKNLGTADDLAVNAAGKYTMYLKNNTINNVNYMWRVAPSISYNLAHFNVGLEYELTSVNYGDYSKMKADATFDSDDCHNVNGHRVCLLVKYNF